jgi:hypothetical protein
MMIIITNSITWDLDQAEFQNEDIAELLCTLTDNMEIYHSANYKIYLVQTLYPLSMIV